ncbi:ribonuclease J [Candidatus Nomurabacteria bacterium]|nr:ribonuclease J [Candidatus Nomurabacteria bacterium]
MTEENKGTKQPDSRFRSRKSRPNRFSRNTKQQLKVCTLSGTEEVGRNCNFIEFGKDILIIDCGFSFPGQELLGIDYLIPNIAYLKRNKKRVKAILITHGHLDHTGGLEYILPELDYPPIYGGKFANALIASKLKEAGMLNKVKLHDIDRNTQMSIGRFKVSFIGVTHSIPNAFSIFVQSPSGNVFFSGDYKIDTDPANEAETDYEALKQLRGKVDLALMESTNSKSEGKAKSGAEIAHNLEDIIAKHDGRIVVAAFSSIISRLYSVIKIAEKLNRKVFISGRSLRNSIAIAQEQHYISVPRDLIQPEKNMSKFQDNQIMFICTGSQAERYSALNRVSLGEHAHFKVKQGDLVILSASEIPGNVTKIGEMTDRLIKRGAELVQNSFMQVHESGHGLKEDMRIMYKLTEPRYVMPIHGSLTMRYYNKKNYVSWGTPEDKVLLTDDGQMWIYEGRDWKRGKQIESKPVMIDGLGVGDIGDIVLKDRTQLAEYGMVAVIMNLNNKTNQIIGNLNFLSRGFVYVKNSQKLFKELDNIVKDTHREWLSSRKANPDRKELRKLLETRLSKYIYKKTEREPMILPVFV